LGTNAHRDWREVIPALATDHHVITLDLPGFGGSDTLPQGYSFEALAATLAEVLERRAIAKTHVIGHSLGAALALHFAHTHPQRLERLILIDTAGILLKSVYVHHVSQRWAPQFGFAPLDQLLSRGANNLNRFILSRLENRFDFSRWLAGNPMLRAALLGGFAHTDAALGLIEHDFTRALHETQVPTTVIWGRNDDVSPLRVGVLLAGRLPNAQLHVIDRAGHTPMHDAPAELMPLLRQGLTVDRWPPRPAVSASASPRSVECINEAGRVFSGEFVQLKLTNCRDARIENARLQRLIAIDSSVVLESVSIVGEDVALMADASFITGTVVDIDARIGIHAANSQLDFAGAIIRARERGIDTPVPSRIYFSVSEMHAPQFSGDLHRIWNQPASE
jgi:pimeloyl-ACP methyl ester carboxylesterase